MKVKSIRRLPDCSFDLDFKLWPINIYETNSRISQRSDFIISKLDFAREHEILSRESYDFYFIFIAIFSPIFDAFILDFMARNGLAKKIYCFLQCRSIGETLKSFKFDFNCNLFMSAARNLPCHLPVLGNSTSSIAFTFIRSKIRSLRGTLFDFITLYLLTNQLISITFGSSWIEH